MHKGIYCLVLRNSPCTISVGALGPITFRGGFHVYVGSALGPGGLARVARHIRCAREGLEKPRWHIDYLLVSGAFTLESVYCLETEERLECRLASIIPGRRIPGFGSSDCRCPSHLFSLGAHPRAHLDRAGALLGLSAHSKTIKT
ncbi:MAG: GIY-YIG nuclease family protein [Methanolinea sp.]|jgi:Uri superfamily endonuclease|nr:GIY-YIG nuclease family protein [Methanolinea sp.]